MSARWLRGLLAILLGTALALGLTAPTSSAGGNSKKVWVSGNGVGDDAWFFAEEGIDTSGWPCHPDEDLAEDLGAYERWYSSHFTSARGEDRGLNGCWYFLYPTIEDDAGTVVDLPGPRYKMLWYPEERFIGTLNGRPVDFKTKNAVVVNWFVGDASDGFVPENQIAGGCYHPLDREDGRGALVFIEQLGTDPPEVRFYGRISVK